MHHSNSVTVLDWSIFLLYFVGVASFYHYIYIYQSELRIQHGTMLILKMLHDFWTAKISRLCSIAKRTMVFGRSNSLSPEVIIFNPQKNLENRFTIKFQPQNTYELSRTWQIKHASRAHKASWSQRYSCFNIEHSTRFIWIQLFL